MVSIILAFVGIMMIASGVGLRETVKFFSGALMVFGFLFLLHGGLGWFLDWAPQKMILIAGGGLLLFSIIAGIWAFIAKFRAIANQNNLSQR